MITYGTSNHENELKGILELQKKNLSQNISIEELRSQGFVTVEHDLDLLSRMNTPFQHVIAKDGETVIGYALVMLRKWKKEIPVLVDMFDQIDSVEYQQKILGQARYFIMGQICIDKAYRGQGIFAGLYQEIQKRMKDDFDYIITEIASRNHRSLRAHQKVGFKTIKTYQIGNEEEWVLVLKKLNQ